MNQKRIKKQGWKIPLFFAIFTALLSIVLIAEALNSDGTRYFLPFVGYGGTFNPFGHENLRVFFIAFSYFLAVTCAITVSVVKRESVGFKISEAILYSFLFFVQAFIGARILYCIEKILNCRILIFKFDGQSLFGGLYASLLYIPLYAKKFRKQPDKLFEYSVPICLLILIFCRLGCFFSGCCATGEYCINGSPIIYPAQLFEIFFDLIIFSICIRYKDKEREHSNVFPLMMVLYCSMRFLIEFIRWNEKILFIFSIGQIHCVIYIIVSIVWIHRNGKTVWGELKYAFSPAFAERSP